MVRFGPVGSDRTTGGLDVRLRVRVVDRDTTTPAPLELDTTGVIEGDALLDVDPWLCDTL